MKATNATNDMNLTNATNGTFDMKPLVQGASLHLAPLLGFRFPTA
jgi:hypothetical protein